MRILHLDAGREMRGGQWQVLRLVEGLAAAGVESTLLARQDAPLYVAARKQGWRVEPLGVTRALGCLRGHQLIHAHDARSHSLGAFLRGRPLVVSRRVSFPVGSRWKYGRARRYLAVSEFVKKVLMEGGVPEEKISVVYDGVPVLEVSHGKQVLGLEKDSGLLAHMGLKMVSHLEEEIPDAAILVYVTNSEGLGSGALLAMSAAVPVIASNVSAGWARSSATAKTACWWRTTRPPSPAPSANCSTTRNRRAKSAPPRAVPSSSDLPWTAWSRAPWKPTAAYSRDWSSNASILCL